MADGLKDVLQKGECNIKDNEVNKVIYKNQDIKIINIRNWMNKKENETDKKGQTKESQGKT